MSLWFLLLVHMAMANKAESNCGNHDVLSSGIYYRDASELVFVEGYDALYMNTSAAKDKLVKEGPLLVMMNRRFYMVNGFIDDCLLLYSLLPFW
jgi:hypothetical protein